MPDDNSRAHDYHALGASPLNKIEAATIGKTNISIYKYDIEIHMNYSNLNKFLASEIINKAHERSFTLIRKLVLLEETSNENIHARTS